MLYYKALSIHITWCMVIRKRTRLFATMLQTHRQAVKKVKQYYIYAEERKNGITKCSIKTRDGKRQKK